MQLVQDRKGFTLVELLVVLAILGVLAVIGLRSYSNYVDKTYCSNVESVSSAAMLQASKLLRDTGSTSDIDDKEASAIFDITYPDSVASVKTYWDTTEKKIKLVGKATGDKCPKGKYYVMYEDEMKGSWTNTTP